ncbi:LysR family transcriptional regulator [Avibacterium paragallinarum]|uniref:LysR substrate-binding domain-containing protein n=1 Tax=Avibacterium paragallinarum TaxID=728 RepID=A0ABU7QND3_AVIPA|nr:LysR family transcriptional regulator [Avibacterium paragallinarum]
MDRLTAIKVFLEAAHTRSFTATAEHLSISRPMVTRYIGLMENWLNARLFHRTTRYITLTEAGEKAQQYCEQLLTLSEELEDALSNQQNELQGTLRLTSSISFGATHLMKAINEFQQHYPKLNIFLNLSEDSLNLVEQGIDLAIRISNNPDPILISRPLGKCHSILVASTQYIAQYGKPKSPDELLQHRYLAHSKLNRAELRLHQGEQQAHLSLTNRLSANDANALLNAVLNNAGIAMLPRYLTNELIERGELCVILPDWELPVLTIYGLYSSRDKLPRQTRLFLDFLVEQFKDKNW